MKTLLIVLVAILLIGTPALFAASDVTLENLAQEVTAIKNTLVILIGVHDSNVEIYNNRINELERRLSNVENYLRQDERRSMVSEAL